MTELDKAASLLCYELSDVHWSELSEEDRAQWRKRANEEAGFPGYDFTGSRIVLTGHDDF